MRDDDATPTRRAARNNGADGAPTQPKPRRQGAVGVQSQATRRGTRGASGNAAGMAKELEETQRRLAATSPTGNSAMPMPACPPCCCSARAP
ncbi:MAG: hypothetical protein ACXVCO_10585, partial [Ktedonobacterales bacterium]